MKIQSQPFQSKSRPNSTPPNSDRDPIGNAIDHLTLSPLQIGTDLLDSSLALGYATQAIPASFQGIGYAVGATHVAMALGYAMGAADADSNSDPKDCQSRMATGLGHLLLGAGHIAGAAGAGAVSLAPIAGGLVLNTLQNYRDRSQD